MQTAKTPGLMKREHGELTRSGSTFGKHLPRPANTLHRLEVMGPTNPDRGYASLREGGSGKGQQTLARRRLCCRYSHRLPAITDSDDKTISETKDETGYLNYPVSSREPQRVDGLCQPPPPKLPRRVLHRERGRLLWIRRLAVSHGNQSSVGGVIVVGGRENRPHGEGRQFIARPKQTNRVSTEVKSS